MRSSVPHRVMGLAAVALLCAVVALPAEAAASRTRPGRSTAAPSPARGQRPAGGTVRRATGRATYGYGRFGHHHHSFHGFYAYGYSPWFGLAPYWGGWWYPAPNYVLPPDGTAPLGVVETAIRPKSADVWVDGELAGEARDYNGRWDRLWLPPGEHTLEFTAPGHMTLRRQVRVPPAGLVVIEDQLREGEGFDPRSSAADEREASPEPSSGAPAAAVPEREPGLRQGLLHLEVHPADAAVYLDGVFLARADELSRLHGALPVAVGGHTVDVVRPGNRGETKDVDVQEGEPTRISLELKRE